MRNVVYCAPYLGVATTHRFAEALRGLRDVRLLAVCQELPAPRIRALYDHIEVVPSALHAGQLYDGVERLRARFGAPHRILGILENLQVQLAHLREHYGLPGPSPEAADRFRDKGRMKEALHAHGIPVAHHARITHPDHLRAFVDRVSLPIVLKPPDGAGGKGIVEVHTDRDLEDALAMPMGADRPVLAEEFLEGRELSFETLCIGGEPVFHSIGEYSPRPLEVVRTPWIQWVCVLPRDISGPRFERARAVGTDALRALGMGTGMTHMEWFERPDGSIAVGEIAMRPPGAQFVSLMSHAHDTDLYRAWARAVVDEAFDGPIERERAAAAVYLRGSGPGERVAGVHGLTAAQREVGHLVVEATLPIPGAPRNRSYEGDGYVIVKHRDTPVVVRAAQHLIETIEVTYE